MDSFSFGLNGPLSVDTRSGIAICCCRTGAIGGNTRKNKPIAGKNFQTEQERFEGYVFEGRLTAEEVDSVRKVVMSPDFQELSEPAQLKIGSEFLSINVFRQSQKAQSLRLSATGDYKKNEAALKPLFDWMKQMEKRKHDVSKAEGNHCKLPARVEFRQPAPQP
jgi:hypothetical protein